MVWEGVQRVTGLAGGQHGGFVQLGDAIVPPKAEMTFEGTGGSPDVQMRFEIRDGRPECVEINVMAKPDGRGIRSADMAMFNLDNLAIGVFGQLATIGVHAESEQLSALRSVGEARSARRPTVTRADLDEVARVYRAHVEASPTRAVELLLGYSARTAARRVAQAREAGLLPRTTPGKRKA
ncbi:MAG TPA: hypothetical protein VIY28_05180 [Pseudonocardiaceae bacterium]